MILKFLSHFDLFKRPVILYYHGESKKSSSVGIFFSFAIFMFLIYEFSRSEFFSKSSPIAVIQSLQSPSAEKIQFTSNHYFVVAVADKKMGKVIIDPSIFSVEVIYINQTRPIVQKIHACTLDDVPNKNATLFKIMQANHMFCLENKELALEGYMDESSFKFLMITLNICNNLTSNGTCKSPEEIKSFFKSKILSIGYSNAEINAKNYENPFNLIIDPSVISLDYSFSKTNYVFLKKAEVMTDDGWLFPSLRIESNFMFDRSKLDLELRDNASDPLVKWYFYASKNKTFCDRKYQKLPEIIAYVVGMANFLMIICLLITNLFTYVSNLKFMLNKLYYFESILKTNKDKDKEIHQNTKNESIVKKNENLIKANIDLSEISIDSKELESQTDTNKRLKELKLSNFSPKTSKKNKLQMTLELKSQTKIKAQDSSEISIISSPKNTIPINLPLKPENTNTKNNSNESPPVFNNIKDNTEANSVNSLNISFYEYLKFLLHKIFFCFKNKNDLRIGKAEKIFRKEMDVINIVKKIHDIENLKLLLLDEDQLILFNYLRKPLINLDKNRDNCLLLNKKHKNSDLTKEKNSRKKFLESLTRCSINRQTNAINKRLVEFLDNSGKINKK